MTEEELETIFHTDVPSNVQRAFIQCLFGAYRISHEECTHFPPEEMRDLLGHDQWVQLRYDMRGLADRFHGMVASAEPYHTLITAGRIKLIAASAREPGSPLRPANYKLEYANNSLDLFDSPVLPPSDDAYHFTILHHGVDVKERRQPAFAKILFVRNDMKVIHHFDLFRRHQDLVNSLWIRPTNGEDLPDIRLREDDEERPL